MALLQAVYTKHAWTLQSWFILTLYAHPHTIKQTFTLHIYGWDVEFCMWIFAKSFWKTSVCAFAPTEKSLDFEIW